ncbi:hypothetical protein, partial [Streptomyces sp. NPDC001020]
LSSRSCSLPTPPASTATTPSPALSWESARLDARPSSWKATAALLAALAVLTQPDQRQMRQPFEHDAPVPLDYAAAAHVVAQNYLPGDAVVYDRENTWKLDSGVQYYLPRGLKMRDVFLTRTPAAINDIYPPQCPVPLLCLKEEKRIWLLTQGDDPDPLSAINQDQANALRTRYKVSMNESVTGMTVTLLVARGTARA